MALSNGNGLSNTPLIFLNPRSQDKEGNKIAPHFEIARVGEDKKIKATGETCTRVSGDLKRPRFTTRDFKGVPNKHVILYIQDGDETYNLDLTYRISSRSLFNALLGLTDPKAIEISIYGTKKEGYEALSLWQNGKMVPWKFDGRKGEIPEAHVVMFKGKEQRDFTPTDDFFEEQLKAWADEVFGPEKTKSDAAPAKTETPAENPAPAKAAAKPTAAKTATKPAVPAATEADPDDSIPF